METMNIGEAAKSTGISAKMIRHYESLSLIPRAARTQSGYRQYSSQDVHTLRFIRRARDLGFSIAQIAELVGLWQNRRRTSRKVRELALEQVRQLEVKVAELLEMKATLEHLVHCCSGDDRPECPILDSLASDSATHATAPARRRTRGMRSPTH